MTREDRLVALFGEADPVPDPIAFAAELEVEAPLETIRQRGTTMQDTQIRTLEPPTSRSSRRRWILGAAAAAVVLVGGVGAWLLITERGDSVTNIPLIGTENDPAAQEAFEAVRAAYAAFGSGDAETWVAPFGAGRNFRTPELRDAVRETKLQVYAANRAVNEHIEVTRCLYDGFGDWPGLTDADLWQRNVNADEVPTGYHFTCLASHTNAFHELAGISLSGSYEWVVTDGELIGISSKGYDEAWLFVDDLSAWLLENHEEVWWDVLWLASHPYPQAESAETALEYARLFVEDSPLWPRGS